MKKYLSLIIAAIILCSCSFSSKEEDALWRAINSGNAALVDEAIDMGADIDLFRDRKHYEVTTGYAKKVKNPAWVALCMFEDEIALLLIERGADMNSYSDLGGRSMLQYCIEEKKDMVRPLVEAGADFMRVYGNGLNALDFAAGTEGGRLAFEIFMENGAVPTEKTLQRALENSGLERFGILRKILEYSDGFEIDAALKCALLGKGSEAVQYFEQSDRKSDVILACVSYCSPDVLKELLNRYGDRANRYELYTCALMAGNQENILWLNENYSYKYNASKLGTSAAVSRDAELFKFLNDRNIYFNRDDALKQSILQHDRECTDYLLSDGFFSPLILEYAGLHDDIETVKLLLNNFVGDNTYSMPATVIFAEKGKCEALELLIDAGWTVNGEYNNTSPLFAAVRSGNADCVELLLRNGADREWISPNGTSVRELAENYGAVKIIKLLE